MSDLPVYTRSNTQPHTPERTLAYQRERAMADARSLQLYGMRRNDVRAVERRAARLNPEERVRQIKDIAVGAIALGAADAIMQMAWGSEKGIADYARSLGKAVSSYEDDSERRKLYQELGKMGQDAMMESYEEMVVGEEYGAGASHYRAGEGRLAGGILGNALSRSDFFEVDSRGLAWGNRTMLDAAARHWHRIAFGAEPRGGGGESHHNINIEGMVAELGFSEAPSHGFSMPAGFWIGGEEGGRTKASKGSRGDDEFYPFAVGRSSATYLEQSQGPGELGLTRRYSKKASDYGITGKTTYSKGKMTSKHPGLTGEKDTEGIEGRNFFDAGVLRMADALPELLETYVRRITGEWIDAATIHEQFRLTIRMGRKVRV